MLEQEETLKYLAEAKQGDEHAKSMLIEHNSPLVKSIIRRYKNKGVDYDDLYQLGCMGLLKAIRNFDTSFNVKFSTYAVPMIAGEVKRFLRDDGYIKVSRTLKVLSGKIAQFVESYKSENLTEPDIELIAEKFAIEPGEVVFAMDSAKYPVSIFEKNDDSDDKSPSLIDRLSSEDNGDEIIDNLIVKDILESLPPRDKKIIMLRYFRDKTQSEISKIMGVSQVQISRLETKIIENIRKAASPLS